MIKIIKPGFLKEIQCSKCGAVLQYDEREDVIRKPINPNDFHIDPYKTFDRFIICPQCNNEIKLDEENEK